MSRKRTRRRHYALVNPILTAIEGATILSESKLDQLRMGELSAIDAFSKGAADVDDWRALADMSNLAQTMAGMGIGPEALPAALAVEEVLGEAHARFEKTGKVGTTGPGLAAMRDLYAWHDAQRCAVDRSTYERAIVKTMNRIASAHPGVKVYMSRKEEAAC